MNEPLEQNSDACEPRTASAIARRLRAPKDLGIILKASEVGKVGRAVVAELPSAFLFHLQLGVENLEGDDERMAPRSIGNGGSEAFQATAHPRMPAVGVPPGGTGPNISWQLIADASAPCDR